MFSTPVEREDKHREPYDDLLVSSDDDDVEAAISAFINADQAVAEAEQEYWEVAARTSANWNVT